MAVVMEAEATERRPRDVPDHPLFTDRERHGRWQRRIASMHGRPRVH